MKHYFFALGMESIPTGMYYADLAVPNLHNALSYPVRAVVCLFVDHTGLYHGVSVPYLDPAYVAVGTPCF